MGDTIRAVADWKCYVEMKMEVVSRLNKPSLGGEETCWSNKRVWKEKQIKGMRKRR